MSTRFNFYNLLLPLLFTLSSCVIGGNPFPNQGPERSGQEESTVPTPNREETTMPPASNNKSGWEADLLTMVNDLRTNGCRCGRKRMPPVGPVSLNAKLSKAAQVHANDMNQNNFFDHQGSDGSQISDRATRAGFRWSNIGENISWGYTDTKATFEGWLASKGHCENMMDPDFKEMGAAKKGKYWVQTFGTAR